MLRYFRDHDPRLPCTGKLIAWCPQPDVTSCRPGAGTGHGSQPRDRGGASWRLPRGPRAGTDNQRAAGPGPGPHRRQFQGSMCRDVRKSRVQPNCTCSLRSCSARVLGWGSSPRVQRMSETSVCNGAIHAVFKGPGAWGHPDQGASPGSQSPRGQDVSSASLRSSLGSEGKHCKKDGWYKPRSPPPRRTCTGRRLPTAALHGSREHFRSQCCAQRHPPYLKKQTRNRGRSEAKFWRHGKASPGRKL